MLKYMVRRFINLIPTLIGVSLVVFFMIHLAPGDPITIMVGEDAPAGDIAQIKAMYGLDQPLPVQYLQWLTGVLQGDLGRSIRQNAPVSALIWERMGATFELALFSIIIAAVLAIPVGVLVAVSHTGWVNYFTMIIALIGVSMPGFWLGLMLLTYVALPSAFFPMFGRGAGVYESLKILAVSGDLAPLSLAFRSLLLPALSLGTASTALLTRLVRSSMLDVLSQDYIRTARAKGLNQKRVIFKHGLKNALIPVVTVLGLQLGVLLGGAVITETVFAWPGAGRMIVNAISQRDFPIVQAGTLMLAVIFALVNLLVDISYGFLDPRIRYD